MGPSKDSWRALRGTELPWARTKGPGPSPPAPAARGAPSVVFGLRALRVLERTKNSSPAPAPHTIKYHLTRKVISEYCQIPLDTPSHGVWSQEGNPLEPPPPHLPREGGPLLCLPAAHRGPGVRVTGDAGSPEARVSSQLPAVCFLAQAQLPEVPARPVVCAGTAHPPTPGLCQGRVWGPDHGIPAAQGVQGQRPRRTAVAHMPPPGSSSAAGGQAAGLRPSGGDPGHLLLSEDSTWRRMLS